ncbi:MAG: pirin family protein, partial [Mariprofundaceae bacterium]
DHPHRGFEAITWLFDGGMNHTDNLGNRGTVHAGGAQHFTAGAGIIHSEFPDGRAHGIQLWINLPKRLKSIAPDYQQAEAESVRTNDSDGVTTRHIAGRNGAIQLHSDIAYQQIDLAPGASCVKTVAEMHRGFIYLVAGELWLGEHRLTSGDAACIEDETSLALRTEHGAQLMWCFGKPHHEPIHQHGPFVD